MAAAKFIWTLAQKKAMCWINGKLLPTILILPMWKGYANCAMPCWKKAIIRIPHCCMSKKPTPITMKMPGRGVYQRHCAICWVKKTDRSRMRQNYPVKSDVPRILETSPYNSLPIGHYAGWEDQ